MKKIFLKISSLFCVLVMLLSMGVTNVYASQRTWASEFAYTLNSAMLERGVVSTSECGGYEDFSNGIPSGVIYADLVRFTNDDEPCLVIISSDAQNACVSVDIYRYNGKDSRLVTTLRKPYNINQSNIAEIAFADSGNYRYIVYKEYADTDAVCEEYYTVIDNDAFKRVDAPENSGLSGVLTFKDTYLHPEVDVSYYNQPLSVFFSMLKDYAASNVTYDDILSNITSAERDRLARVLGKTAGFTDEFDIGKYSSMSEYSLAVKKHDGEREFNAITNVYDIGDGMYYVRYSTDLCFYNGTILRRTDKVTDNYQVLNVRNDFIPFSDVEIKSLKEAYQKNRLVLEKSSGGMELANKPIIEVNKLDIEKPLEIEQRISPTLRIPLALIGGGVCLALFIALWLIMKKE